MRPPIPWALTFSLLPPGHSAPRLLAWGAPACSRAFRPLRCYPRLLPAPWSVALGPPVFWRGGPLLAARPVLRAGPSRCYPRLPPAPWSAALGPPSTGVGGPCSQLAGPVCVLGPRVATRACGPRRGVRRCAALHSALWQAGAPRRRVRVPAQTLGGYCFYPAVA